MGTKEGALIPVRNHKGVLAGYLQDRQSQPVRSVFQEAALKSLAKEAQGGFFTLTQDGTLAQQVYGEIQKVRESHFKNKGNFYDYDEKFFWLLGVSLIFIFLEKVIRVRKEKGVL